MSQQDFDAKDFRRALSQFPTGVTVITTNDKNGNPVGVTASSFNSVSIDPALVLWSIDKGANSLTAFEQAEYFSVNVLNREQVATSNNFASRGTDKFANIEYSKGLGDVPILNDYAAQFECKTWAVYEGGDHLIIVGQVEKYRYVDGSEPLVFARGSYALSSQHPQTIKTAPNKQSTENGFAEDYMLYLLRVGYQLWSTDLYAKFKNECGITPEEWRILAHMIDHNSLSLDKLSDIVLQPDISLHITIDQMVEKELVTLDKNGVLSLTEKGIEVSGKMQQTALREEAEVLSHMSESDRAILKANLKTMLEKLS